MDCMTVFADPVLDNWLWHLLDYFFDLNLRYLNDPLLCTLHLEEGTTPHRTRFLKGPLPISKRPS